MLSNVGTFLVSGRAESWADQQHLEPCDADPDGTAQRNDRDHNAPRLPSAVKAAQLTGRPDAQEAEAAGGPRRVP